MTKVGYGSNTINSKFSIYKELVILAVIFCTIAFTNTIIFPINAETLNSENDKEVQASDATSNENNIVLDPVVVTARKRVEKAQDVPNSMTVIEMTPTLSTSDNPGASIVRETPNATFGDFGQPGTSYVAIRGIGPLGQPHSPMDNTVGYSTNGAPTSAFGFPPSLLDVERIEVLRGPQGTLYGRGALGGAINVITNPADGEREFRVTGEVGTEKHALAEGVAGGWIMDGVLAGRGALRFQTRDGDIPNGVVGKDEGDTQFLAGRGTLTLTPNDDFTGTLIISADKDTREQNYQIRKEQSGYPLSGTDFIPENTRDRKEGTLELEHEFDDFVLTSLTNFQAIKVNTETDYTDLYTHGVNTPGADYFTTDEKEKIFSQEFRVSSPAGDDLSWVAGINYFRSDLDHHRSARHSNGSPLFNGEFDTEITSQTWSVFGDASVPVTDRLTLSGGMRFSHDDQRLDDSYANTAGVTQTSQKQDVSDSYITGRAAISYDWTNDFMTYASVARGYASGGFAKVQAFSPLGGQTNSFDPSTAWTYEVGSKASFFENKAELDAALFYNDVSDGQLVGFQIVGGVPVYSYTNQDYKTYGLEVEGRALLTEDLEVWGGIGVMKSELGSVTAGGGTKGNEVPGAAEFNANVGLMYDFLDDFSLSGQYQFVGARTADIANNFDLDEYHIVNGRLGWGDEDFQVYAFANNILDEHPEYFGTQNSSTNHAMTVGLGRVVGIGITKSF